MTEKTILESSILHLVKTEDLDNHGTLFAGQMAKWLIEAGLIMASRLLGRLEDIVCVKVNELIFKKPVYNSDLIDIKTKVALLGSTSITIYSEVWRKNDNEPVVSNMATYVTVDKQNKPYPHGLKLTEGYISENRSIHEKAIINRGR